jgi:O-antigen biosynthesis protein
VEADVSNAIGEAVERFVPGKHTGELMEAQHLARYWWVSSLVPGRRVLDAGCGVGYGSAILSRAGAAEVTGVDVAPDAVDAAIDAYPGVGFQVADVHALPFEAARFDVVICFEVIEHVEGQDEVIAELARVLAPDGILALSSPNRGVYPAGNPHHLHEYVPDELEAALRTHFPHVALMRQHDWLASAVLTDDRVAEATLSDLDVGVAKAIGLEPGSETYTVALASRRPLPSLRGHAVLASPDEVRTALELGARARALEAQRDQALEDLRNLEAVEAQLRSEKAILGEQLEEVQRRLRAIHASLPWRLGARLRRLLSRRR